jgi:hypothetical protein
MEDDEKERASVKIKEPDSETEDEEGNDKPGDCHGNGAKITPRMCLCERERERRRHFVVMIFGGRI